MKADETQTIDAWVYQYIGLHNKQWCETSLQKALWFSEDTLADFLDLKNIYTEICINWELTVTNYSKSNGHDRMLDLVHNASDKAIIES